MQYQRARLVAGGHEFAGARVWVEVSEPEDRIALRNNFDLQDHSKVKITDELHMLSTYVTNVRSFAKTGTAKHETFLMPADWIELLDEFADDVPIVSWDEWLAENAKFIEVLN